MTEVTVQHVDADQDDALPHGTAIVRPVRHVRAVRERYLLRFASPSEAAVSRSARAWSWALGETSTAPVTDQETITPPSRSEIEAEIAVAEDRRLRGDREARADAVATVLRWLIGDDDHVPVRGDNPGSLVGGFGDVVRSSEQIADVLALATEGVRQDTAYVDGVQATLEWVLGNRAEAPITCACSTEVTTRDVKMERLHAGDVIEQARNLWMAGQLPLPQYAEGVALSIAWLLGDSTAPPASRGLSGPGHRRL